MASEQEELRLTVSLVDNASAGIVALKNNIQSLTSGQTRQSFDTFKRQQREMGEQIKDLAGIAVDGEKALISYIAKFGAVGLAASAGIAAMKTFGQNLYDIGQMGRSLGVPATHIKNIVDQFTAAGATTEEATAEVKNFTLALVDVGRQGTPQWNELMHKAGIYSDQMAGLVRQMEQATDVEDKLNLARQAAAIAGRNRYEQDIKMGESRSQAAADAAKAERETFYLFKLNAELEERVQGDLTKYSADEEKRAQDAINRGVEITRMWHQIGRAGTEAADAIVMAFGPGMANTLGSTVADLQSIVNLLNKVAGWAGLGGDDTMGVLVSKMLGTSKKQHYTTTDIADRLGRSSLPELTGTATGGVAPLIGQWGMRMSDNVIDKRGQSSLGGDVGGGPLDENTKQLKQLNDNLFEILHPTGSAGGGMGLFSGGTAGGGGFGGGGPGGGGRPNGSDVGPGTGPGAAPQLDMFGGAPKNPLSGGADYSGKLGAKLGGKGDPRGLEGYIRQTAAKYGIDPDVAVRVAQSEGLNQFSSGIRGETSWGAFQLHTGGGLGDEFRKETGLDPSDPKNEKATIDYALKKASTGGWGPWHGAANTGISRMQGIGGVASTGPIPSSIAFGNPYRGALVPGGSAAAATSGGMGALPDQSGRPYHQEGSVTLGGQQFGWASGGVKRGSLPYGNYPINIGDQGPIGQRIGAVATVGGRGGEIPDPKFPGQPREGIEIHPGSSNDLDRLYTEGCFGVPPAQWPAFKAALLKEAQGGPLTLSIGRNGRAAIMTQNEMNEARKTVDSHSVRTQKVEATGKLTANINAPAGTDVSLEGGGVFKKIEVNRQVQMSKAQRGPVGGIGHA